MAQRVPVQFVKLYADAKIPEYATSEDSGADLFYSGESFWLDPGHRTVVETGIAIKLPPGYEAQVRPKSGRAAKEGLTVLNTPGTVDNGYRGEIKVILYNTGNMATHIVTGQKIAQLVVAPYVQAAFEEVGTLDETDRGIGGLGYTGLYRADTLFQFSPEDGKRIEYRGE